MNKYKYMGTSPMTVDGKTVNNYGDIIETQKEITHHLFRLLVDKPKKLKSIHYGGK